MNPFTPQIIGWAQDAEQVQQIPASINMAISEVESGSPPGTHIPAGTNNWHGITDAHGAQAATHEDTASGVDYSITRGFKVFASPAASYAECARIIGHVPVYAPAVRAFLASPRAPADVQALALGIALHWATDENKNGDYHKRLWKVMDTYNLYQYDASPVPAPATSPSASAGTAPQGTPPMPTVAPAPVIVPATVSVAPAASNQASLNIGDALEILVKAGAAVLPSVISAGEGMLPPPLNLIVQALGPSVFQGYITSAATQLETLVAGKTVAIPSTGNSIVDSLVGMVVSQLNANEFAWVSGFAGLESTLQAQVTNWLATPHAASVAPNLAAVATKPA